MLVASAFCSCTHKAHLALHPEGALATSDWSAITVYAKSNVGRDYEELGPVVVNVPSSKGDNAKRLLQKEAAKLGANAIVDFKLILQGNRATASGIAVRL